jgi:hypothetical protein
MCFALLFIKCNKIKWHNKNNQFTACDDISEQRTCVEAENNLKYVIRYLNGETHRLREIQDLRVAPQLLSGRACGQRERESEREATHLVGPVSWYEEKLARLLQHMAWSSF